MEVDVVLEVKSTAMREREGRHIGVRALHRSCGGSLLVQAYARALRFVPRNREEKTL